MNVPLEVDRETNPVFLFQRPSQSKAMKHRENPLPSLCLCCLSLLQLFRLPLSLSGLSPLFSHRSCKTLDAHFVSLETDPGTRVLDTRSSLFLQLASLTSVFGSFPYRLTWDGQGLSQEKQPCGCSLCPECEALKQSGGPVCPLPPAAHHLSPLQ